MYIERFHYFVSLSAFEHASCDSKKRSHEKLVKNLPVKHL